MSLSVKTVERHSYFNTIAVTSFASAALLIVQMDFAQSAVFEQMDNGTVVQVAGGVSEDTPPASTAYDGFLRNHTKSFAEPPPAVLAGYPTKEQTGPVGLTGAVILDMVSSASPPAPRGIPGQVQLPSPRDLSRMLSRQQREMRQLAAKIGLSFARHPGVIRAKLDEATFVALFTAMIHRESNFNPNAVSPVGAGGLGQLMPATARELGVCDVFSAHDNLTGAARYLTSMLDQFGSAELALAAYNAGPGAVRKYGGVPPYRETRQYVADIVNALDRGPPRGRLLAYGGDPNPSSKTAEASITANFEVDDPIPSATASCRHTRGVRK